MYRYTDGDGRSKALTSMSQTKSDAFVYQHPEEDREEARGLMQLLLLTDLKREVYFVKYDDALILTMKKKIEQANNTEI